MRALLAALAVALVPSLVPAPAYAAATVPDCAVALVNAAAGESRSCETAGLPPMGNRNVGPYRTLYVVAESGSARATVACPTVSFAATVTAPGAEDAGGWTADACVLTLTALAGGTTAQAASLGSYVVSLD